MRRRLLLGVLGVLVLVAGAWTALAGHARQVGEPSWFCEPEDAEQERACAEAERQWHANGRTYRIVGWALIVAALAVIAVAARMRPDGASRPPGHRT